MVSGLQCQEWSQLGLLKKELASVTKEKLNELSIKKTYLEHSLVTLM